MSINMKSEKIGEGRVDESDKSPSIRALRAVSCDKPERVGKR